MNDPALRTLLRRRWVRGAALACVALAAMTGVALAACGGGDDDGGADGPSPEASAATPATVTQLDDAGYLKVFCEGLSDYQDALLVEPTAEGIAKTIEAYVAAMKAVRPPEDLQAFHDEYVAYLEGALDEPTSLLTTDPPEPPEEPRQRLRELIDDTPECKYPNFLSK
jgi:hypothetical protein